MLFQSHLGRVMGAGLLQVKRDLAAEFKALAELARAGQLELLRVEHFDWLRDALLDTNRKVLDWHALNGDGALVWCWRCRGLRGREHECG